jgi:uncharacterized membrane protein
VLAIVLLLLICFMAGLLARLALARRAVGALEANVLSRLPAYALLKTKTQSMLSLEDIEGMSVAVVRFDDLWQIGFEIERIEGGKVALFLPGSPDPWSGSVCIAEEDRVTEGKELAFIPTGEELPTNVGFGRGEESDVLYVTSGKSLYKIQMAKDGYQLPDSN